MFVAKISTARQELHAWGSYEYGKFHPIRRPLDRWATEQQSVNRPTFYLSDRRCCCVSEPHKKDDFWDGPTSFLCPEFSVTVACGAGLRANKLATRKNSHTVDILAKNTVFTANGAISCQTGCFWLPDIWMRVEFFSSKKISPVPPSNYALKGLLKDSNVATCWLSNRMQV